MGDLFTARLGLLIMAEKERKKCFHFSFYSLLNKNKIRNHDLPFRRQSAQMEFSFFRMSSMSNFSFSSAISNGFENELK